MDILGLVDCLLENAGSFALGSFGLSLLVQFKGL